MGRVTLYEMKVYYNVYNYVRMYVYVCLHISICGNSANNENELRHT